MSKPIIYPITLDMRRNLHQVIVMKENDANSRIIQAKITDNGKLYNLLPKDSSSDNYIAVNWHKPDGCVIQNIAYSLADNNTIEVVCTDQMLCVAGIAQVEFVIYRSNLVVSTMKFTVSVDARVVNNHMIESSNEFGLLNDLIAKNKDLRDELETLHKDVSDAELVRKEAEEKREENEINRNEAEINRESTFKGLVNTANDEIERLRQENDTATVSAELATKKADEAADSADKASISEENALLYSDKSTQMADLAKSYAIGTSGETRENDATDNSKYYYELAKAHALASGGIIFMGSKTFAELSLPENQETNYMFNITEDFVTDNTFNVGEGIPYSMGTNVCRTADGFWDVFCGIESFGTGEIVTESIEDEPLDQDEGEYWIFNY